MMTEPTIIDWLQWGFLLIAFGFFIYAYTKISNSPASNYLFSAFLLKAFGGLMFALVYIYYYKFGDSFRYFADVIRLNNVFSSDFGAYLKLMSTSNSTSSSPEVFQLARQFNFARETEAWFMVRLTSPFALVTANSYLGTTFGMSMLSLIGGWQIFKLSNYILKDRYSWSFGIAFLVPSAIFWGSGILKDTYTLLAVSVWALAFYRLIHGHGSKMLQILLILIASYVLYTLKAYILISMLPWFFLSLYLTFWRKIGSPVLKIASLPFLLSILSVIAYYASTQIVSSTEKYNVETLETRANGFQSWHKTLGGSYYDLGEIEYTPTGILAVSPKALSATLFQPFPWEVSNPFMGLTSLEGLIFMFLVGLAIYRARWRFFVHLFRSAFLFGAFFYCLIFGIAVGMNSYNYGALARYKLPMLSIFLLLIVYIIQSATERRKLSEAKKA
jgi:hypothetical protein